MSEALCQPLVADDFGLQAMPDASPPKWHLAHTTWFFETFLLKPFLSGYRPFHPQFEYLFNSYYEQVGAQFPRPQRGLLSRPTIDEVYRYRVQVDAAMEALLAGAGEQHWAERAADNAAALLQISRKNAQYLTVVARFPPPIIPYKPAAETRYRKFPSENPTSPACAGVRCLSPL
jgi:hypothetical protein